MKTSERVPGVSLSRELGLLAEFRIQTCEKLQRIERLVSGLARSVGIEPDQPLVKRDPTTRYAANYEPAITKQCLLLLIATSIPLTIGQICSELQSCVDLAAAYEDPLRVVSESLHQLASILLVVPVEREGIRKWVWTGTELPECGENAVIESEHRLGILSCAAGRDRGVGTSSERRSTARQ